MEEDKKSWNTKKEEKIKQWKKICFCYNHLHEKEKIILKKKTKFLLVLSLLLSSSVAIISSVATSLSNNFWLIVSSAILSGLSAGISLYTKTEKPEEKMIKHNDSARGYRELVLKIEQQLILDFEDRFDANQFIKEITTQMLELETGTESMPIITKKDLKKMDDMQESSSDENNSKFQPFYITKNKQSKKDEHNSKKREEIITHKNDDYSSSKNEDLQSSSSNDEKINDIEKQIPQELKLTANTLQDNEYDTTNIRSSSPLNITGLTHDKNKKFQLFFDKYPSINKEIIEFQRNRFDEN